MNKILAKELFKEYASLAQSLDSISEQTEDCAELVLDCLKNGNKILIAGNGGSAAEATHIAAEFTGRFKLERSGWPAISLSTDQSAVTAIANDYGYDEIFTRQIEALGNKGDIFIALSTSGNSVNLLKAVSKARLKKLLTVSLTGKSGGELAGQCDVDIRVPSDNTPRIQEVHLLILHAVCEMVETELVSGGGI